MRSKSTTEGNGGTGIDSNALGSVFQVGSERNGQRCAASVVGGGIVGASVHVAVLAVDQGEEEARSDQ